MSKKIFICIIFIIVALNVAAWERHSDTTFLISIKGGMSVSNVTGFDVLADNYFGQYYELMFTFHPNQEYSFHTGFGFIQKGFINDIEYYNWLNESIGHHPTTYRFNYFNIPFTFRYNLGRQKFNVYLTAGLNINFLQNQKTYADLPEIVDDIEIEPFEINSTELYKKVNFGYHAGAGMEYKIYPAFSVFLDGRYYKDFLNMYRRDVAGNLKHKSYSLCIGVKIGIPVKYNVYYR